MRLRSHLIALVLAVLLPVVALTAVTVLWVVRLEREAAERATRETARSIGVRVDRELARAVAALQVLAGSPHLDRGDLAAFSDAARTAVTIEGGWIYLSDVEGQQVMNHIAEPGTPLPRRMPAAMVGHRRVVETREPSVSDFVVGALSRKPILNVEVPVIRGGRVTHVLSMAVPAAVLSRVLAEAAPPPEWIIAIVDRRGTTIARSHSPEQFVGQPIKADIAARVAQSPEGTFSNVTRDGVPVHNAFTRSAITSWPIIVGVPKTIANAPLRQALWVLGGIGLMVAVIGVGGALAVGRRIVHPVTEMVGTARALGEGHPTTSAPRSDVAEINELAQALDQAAGLVREREETQRQLHVALADADRMKDEFLAALSHELRTPMTAILGWSRMMETRQMDEATVRKAVASIRRNAELQAHLIEDVLDVSRIITGNIALNRQACDPAVIVRESVEEYLPAAVGKGIGLGLTVEGTVGPLVADAARLKQIVSNLVSNAVKFTPREGRVDVRVEETDGALRIVVRDTGIGIDREFLPHAFDRFRQADGSTTRAYGGLGLGLSIVRDLVALHGGQVTADSPGEGQGTTVRVRLPIERPAPGERVRGAAAASLAGDLRGLRILIVEDDPDAREFLAELLRRRGVSVTETISAGDALAALRGGQYDLVISDIGLPGRDGYALIEDLRAGGNEVPAIAITAYARPEDRERALAAGFQRHIAKPFKPTEVLRAVAEVSQERDEQ